MFDPSGEELVIFTQQYEKCNSMSSFLCFWTCVINSKRCINSKNMIPIQCMDVSLINLQIIFAHRVGKNFKLTEITVLQKVHVIIFFYLTALNESLLLDMRLSETSIESGSPEGDAYHHFSMGEPYNI